MSKEMWVRPQGEIQQFAANEYVAACGDTEYGVYRFKCDAPEGPLYYYNKDGKATLLGNLLNNLLGNGYHPCSKTHEASVSSDFPKGFVDRNLNWTEDDGEAVIVWIEWGSDEGRQYVKNAHATTKLNQDSWEVTKS